MRLSDLKSRSLAFFTDFLIASLLSLATYFIISLVIAKFHISGKFGYYVLIIYYLVSCYFMNGQTLGLRLAKSKLANNPIDSIDQAPHPFRVWLRVSFTFFFLIALVMGVMGFFSTFNLVSFAFILIGLLDFAFIFVSKDKVFLHDYLSRTRVIEFHK